MAQKQAKKHRTKKHRKFWFGFKVFILLFLLIMLVGGIILYFKYGDDIFAMQDEARALVQASSSETFRSSETTLAYNSKGKQIAVIKGDKDAYYVTLDNIPDYVKNAMIVTEDKKFYEHNGIDFKGILRAFLALIKNNGEKTQGASTITQQLARGVFLNTDKTYERKIKEIFIAQELEKKYNKDEILEYYLNTICFANGYYGIEAAAKGYFSKSCQDLSLAQLCFLCAIPNNPSLYDPEKKFDNTVKRKNRILDQMLSDGVINQVEYDEAYNEKIKLKVQEVKMRDYIQSFISYSAAKALMKKNGFEFQYSFDNNSDRDAYEQEYNEAYDTAQQMLKNNGYRIYTSIDLTKQKKLQTAINENLSSFKEKGTDGMYEMQGSAVCIDNKTGRVVAIVGGRSQKTQGYSLNRAFQSYRQPGSTIKPIIVYTPSLERGSTANTTVNDHRFEGGPQNSNGRYYGYVSLRFAVEQSLNTVAWQLFQKLTPEVGLDYLKQMNFNRIVKSDYYLPASLGGLTHGVSALEMASAYATIENDGKYREPTCIVKILDADGNVVVDDSVKEKYIYNADAAHAMVDILKGVMSRGTARGLGIDNGMPCAGKTGTTNDKKDGWFCGFSPYYTTAVWIGYDTPKKVDDLYGSTYPGRTWHAFMNSIHEKLEIKDFPFDGKTNSGSSGSSSYSGNSSSSSHKNSGGGGSVDKDSDDDNNDVDYDEDDDMDESKPTKEPESTKVPEPTKEPEATKEPTVTREPEPTQNPAQEGQETEPEQ